MNPIDAQLQGLNVMNPDDLLRNVVMVSVFGLVFTVWCICVVLWTVQYFARRKRIRGRLGMEVDGVDQERTLRLWKELQTDSLTGKAPKESVIRARLAKLKFEAGWKSPPHLVMLRVFVLACIVFVVVYALGGGLGMALAAPGLLAVLFWVGTEKQIEKRNMLFETQLVDALGIAARALRAGHPLAGAFQLASEEIDEPVGVVFGHIAQEQSLGQDMKDSIRKVSESTYNQELRLFATAVSIQLDSGGNLADLMDGLSDVMRARSRLNRRVRVLTAQTQLSKRILIALPILLFVVMNIMNPEYMSLFYTTPQGRVLLGGTVGLVCFGTWVMSRMAVLRY